MAKRQQNPHRKPARPARRPAAPGELGLELFRQGSYTEAIQQWSKLNLENDAAARAALAEAHFRRGLAARRRPSDALPDLRRAADLLPDEARFWYHLGLTLHLADQLEEARSAYARAAELGLSRRGLGFARGLAEIERSPGLSLETLPWLDPEDRAALSPVAALLRGEPQAALAAASGGADAPAALWRGLAGLVCGDAAAARVALALPKGQRLRAGAEEVRVFYHGLAAAAAGDSQAALAEWTEAARVAAQTNVPILSRLRQGIARLHARRIHEFQTAGQWEEALRAGQAALALAPDDTWLLQASLVAASRLAETARAAGDWAAAISRWQTMRPILESHPGLGPLPPVLRNLAIAHEALEQWEPAAEAWAALLGRLPRRAAKTKAPAPGGYPGNIPLDQQRAWLRRRILDNYKRAGQPDRAITYYKQAIKADPDDLDLRLELAGALLANDQTIAARNEIQRILDKDPRQVDALLLQATVHKERDDEDAAERSLRRVLEIDPGNDTARRGLARLLLERGVDAFNFGSYKRARETYLEALKFSPDDTQVLVFLAETELALKQAAAAREHLEAALATGKVEAYARVFNCWAKQKNEAEARQVLARAEAAGVASPHFYIDVGVSCLTHGVPPSPSPALFGPPRSPAKPKTKAKTEWERWGHELIEKALNSVPNPAETLKHVAAALSSAQPALAVEYARRLAALEPEDPKLQMGLAILQAMQPDNAAAQETLRGAERLARKQGRKDLVAEIANLRAEISSPLFGLVGSLLSRFGPDILEDLDEGDLEDLF